MTEFTGEAELVDARIVYWGVDGSGKRSNMRVIHGKLRPDHRGDLREVPTRLDPTVTYAVLPIELGMIGGVRTRIQIVAVPGAPEHAPTRKQLLDGTDGVVFVVDASKDRVDENLRSFEELRSALQDYGRNLEEVPLVIQYNKRDLGDAFTLDELHRKFSMRGVAAFEAVADEGTAVLQTLTTISKRVIRTMRERNPDLGAPAASSAPAAPVAPEAPAAPAPAEVAAPAPAPPPAEMLSETRAVLDKSFEEARAAVEAEGPGLRIASVGQASQEGDHGLRIPLSLEDEEGRARRVVLRVTLEPEGSGTS
ncbi:MAG: ADP-ribosylation factor-like protein [Myxococcota bacterium]|nr:ADP-ribosylation factor-like protein [Myxococcota bacterium]